MNPALLLALMATAQSASRPPAFLSFADAQQTWAQVSEDRKSLRTAVREGRLKEVHDLVLSIRDGVVTLPYKAGPLPGSRKARLQTLVGQIAQTCARLDQVADARKMARTRDLHARLLRELASVEALYPQDILPSGGARPATAAEKALFLTPSGRYTLSDIQANGNQTVQQKYPGFVSAHDAKPQSGDRLCPISETKANPVLAWVIDGHGYTFCCPPCVTEFLTKAKKSKAPLKAPDAFVKP